MPSTGGTRITQSRKYSHNLIYHSTLNQLINLQTFTDTRGSLTVIERVVPFEIKHVSCLTGNVSMSNSGYIQSTGSQALVCMKGSVRISSNTGLDSQQYVLDSADKCLIINTNDWHLILDFSEESILMVMGSESFNYETHLMSPSRYEEVCA